MNDLQRVPIVDKNGKATHVHKTAVDTSVSQARVAAVMPQSVVDIDPKAKAFANIHTIHSYGCQCPSCEDGTTMNISDWEDKATVGDIVAMLKYPEYILPDENVSEFVMNESGNNKFNLLFNSSFDNSTSQDFVSRMQEEFMYSLRRNSSVVDAHSGDRRFNDEYVAVDPSGCGCTECIIGLYIPEQDWTPYAESGDIREVITGEINNNIGGTDFHLVFYNFFRQESAQEFIKELEDEFDELVHYIDVDEIAEKSH